MTLQEIVDNSRYRLGNYEKPYYWVDAELVAYCNKILETMCRDAWLLKDSLTPAVCEIFAVANTFDYALHASIIFVLSAKIVTQELLTIDTAPATAWAAGDTLTGASSTKTCIVVEKLTDYTYVVEKRSGLFTAGEIISNGTYTADQSSSYPKFTDYEYQEIDKKTMREMDEHYQFWRSSDSDTGEPLRYVLDFNTGYITIDPAPDHNYLLRLSVVRYPITAMTTTSMSGQTPVIDARYHDDIINGICSLALLKRGKETFDPQTAAVYKGLFDKAVMQMKIKNLRAESVQSTQGPHRGFI